MGVAYHTFLYIVVVEPEYVSGQYDFFPFCELDAMDAGPRDRFIGFYNALGGPLGSVGLEILINFSDSFVI